MKALLANDAPIQIQTRALAVIAAVSEKHLDCVKELTRFRGFQNKAIVVTGASVAVMSALFYKYYWSTQASNEEAI